MTKPTLCIHCQHYSKDGDYHLCNHPEMTTLDVVTGDTLCDTCDEARLGKCGTDGTLFERRPPPNFAGAVKLAIAVIALGLAIAVVRMWIRANNTEAPKVPTYFYDSIEQPKTNR